MVGFFNSFVQLCCNINSTISFHYSTKLMTVNQKKSGTAFLPSNEA